MFRSVKLYRLDTRWMACYDILRATAEEVTLQAPQVDERELMKITAVSHVIMKKLSKNIVK